MSEKKRLDAEALEVESLEVEELDAVAGGGTDQNVNCFTCTCPPQQTL
jgi:hypothetical protein